VLGNLIYTA